MTRQNGNCISLPRKRGISHAPCRTIHLINAPSCIVCVFLLCCQHCSHLYLQLFLIIFDSSIALMWSSGRTWNDYSLEHVWCWWAFSFSDCGHAVSEWSHIHAEHFQSICANIFQHEIVTLYRWEFTVFDDTLACALPLTHDVHHEMGCEWNDVYVFSTWKTHVEQVSFLLLTQQERPLDLGRLVSRQHLGMHVFSDIHDWFQLRLFFLDVAEMRHQRNQITQKTARNLPHPNLASLTTSWTEKVSPPARQNCALPALQDLWGFFCPSVRHGIEEIRKPPKGAFHFFYLFFLVWAIFWFSSFSNFFNFLILLLIFWFFLRRDIFPFFDFGYVCSIFLFFHVFLFWVKGRGIPLPPPICPPPPPLVFLTTFGPHHFGPRPPLGPLSDQTVLCPNLCESSLKNLGQMGLLFGTICCSCLGFFGPWTTLRGTPPLPKTCAGSPVVVSLLCCVVWCVGAVCVQNFRGSVQNVGAPPTPPADSTHSAGPLPRRTAQNFALFFLSSATIFILVEFWWCDRRPGPSNVHVWSSRAVVWSPGGPEAAGVSHDSPRAQTCTFEGPGLQSHHQNSTKRPPREEEKNENSSGRRRKKKKREILGPPPFGPPTLRGPTFFQVWACTLRDTSLQGPSAEPLPPLDSFWVVCAVLLLILLLVAAFLVACVCCCFWAADRRPPSPPTFAVFDLPKC